MRLYLDTSTLLHFTTFDEVDWCTKLGAETVGLVIPLKVTQELERHKRYHERRRIRQRAAMLIQKILSFSEHDSPATIRPGVQLELEFTLPQSDITQLGLDPYTNDDWILASVLLALPEHDDARLMTDDAGMILKAKHFSVPHVRPPDDLRLPDEDDPDQRKIRDLESKILEIESAQPNLSVTFRDGENVLKIRIQLPENQHDALERELERARAETPLLSEDLSTIKELGLDSFGPTTSNLFGGANQDLQIKMIQKYNQALKEWYQAYEQFLTLSKQHLIQGALTLPIDLSLKNSGAQPAEDIDVYLQFPAYLRLAKDRLPPPVAPKHPAKPVPADVLLGLAASSKFPPSPPVTVGDAFRLSDVLNRKTLVAPALQEPDIGPSFPSPSTARFEIPKLKHYFVHGLPDVLATFAGPDQVQSFSIAYRIYCGNLTARVEGSVSVVLEK